MEVDFLLTIHPDEGGMDVEIASKRAFEAVRMKLGLSITKMTYVGFPSHFVDAFPKDWIYKIKDKKELPPVH